MPKGNFLFIYAKQALVWFGLNKSHIYRQKAVHMYTFPEHTHTCLWVVMRAPLFVSPPFLTPKVVVVGAGASGRISGPEGGTLRIGVSALPRGTPEIWLRPPNLGGHSGSQAGCAGRRAARELSSRARCSDIQNPHSVFAPVRSHPVWCFVTAAPVGGTEQARSPAWTTSLASGNHAWFSVHLVLLSPEHHVHRSYLSALSLPSLSATCSTVTVWWHRRVVPHAL